MRLLLIFSVAFLAVCCKQNPNTSAPEASTAAAPAELQLSPDFKEFYTRFHADSAYQMEHIIWPLEGITTVERDSSKRERITTKFEQKDWRMHRALEGTDFVQNWTSFADGIYEESIRYAAANYGMSRRFAKIAGEWHLVFYSDMQDLGQGAPPSEK
jgi:hypothetical protein